MSAVRTAAERLSRGVVLKRHLPRDFGSRPIYVSPDSALRYWRLSASSFDPMLLRVVRDFVRAGDTVFDVGANVGLFAFAAAHLAAANGRVLAVEADAWLASLLVRSARMDVRGEAPVSVVCAAAADRSGLASFSIASRGRSSNFLTDTGGNSQTGGTRYTTIVAAVTIDALAEHAGAPAVVKIDVEGAEGKVLRGASKVLSKDRPVLLCEVEERVAPEAGEIFRAHGYALFDAEGSSAYRPIETPAFNTLACPKERLPAFPTLAR